MKRKYYLRGLGLGMLITALVFTITGPEELSDEEIIKRAEELGYVKEEDSSLGIKDLLNKETPVPTKPVHTVEIPGAEKTPTPTATPTPQPVANNTPTPKPTTTPTSAPEATMPPTPVPTETPTPTVTDAPEASIVTATIVIERGNTATMVCNKMQEAGIVKNGDDFKQYLVKHNLTDYINVGTYTFSNDMSYEEMAKLLTGR